MAIDGLHAPSRFRRSRRWLPIDAATAFGLIAMVLMLAWSLVILRWGGVL